MSWFPQIGSGSVAQYPLERIRHWRTVANRLENGERIMLPDYGSAEILWDLAYEDLSDAEVAGIRSLYDACHGEAGWFSFIDPLVNLIGWSEDLARSSWQHGQLSLATGIPDPHGTQRASRLTNPAQAAQSLSQTLGIRGELVACFSAWVRSASIGVVAIQRDGHQSIYALGPAWKRISVTGPGTQGQADSTFSLRVEPGQAIEVWGLQVEAQPAASVYKASGAATGIYPETRFASPELAMVSAGPGRTACRLRLISRIQDPIWE